MNGTGIQRSGGGGASPMRALQPAEYKNLPADCKINVHANPRPLLRGRGKNNNRTHLKQWPRSGSKIAVRADG